MDRVCLVDHVDLICSLYSWWEDFRSSSLDTLPLGFNCGFISTSGFQLRFYFHLYMWVVPWVPSS